MALNLTLEALHMVEAVAPTDGLRITLMTSLARCYEQRPQTTSAAEKVYRDMLALVETPPFDADPSLKPDVLAEYGVFLQGEERLEEAEGALRRSLTGFERTTGLDNPFANQARESLASVLASRGDLRGAIELMREVVDAYTTARGADDAVFTADAQMTLAMLLLRYGRWAEARALADPALAVIRAHGSDSGNFGRAIYLAGRIAAAQGRVGEARALIDEALRVSAASWGADSDHVKAIRDGDADLRLSQGDAATAEAMFARALAQRRPDQAFATFGASAMSGHVRALLALDRPADALAAARAFEAEFLGLPQAQQSREIGSHMRVWLGESLRRTGRAAEALPVLQNAVAGLEATLDPDAPALAQARAVLARTLLDLGKRAEARALIAKAAAALAASAPVAAPYRTGLREAQARL